MCRRGGCIARTANTCATLVGVCCLVMCVTVCVCVCKGQFGHRGTTQRKSVSAPLPPSCAHVVFTHLPLHVRGAWHLATQDLQCPHCRPQHAPLIASTRPLREPCRAWEHGVSFPWGCTEPETPPPVRGGQCCRHAHADMQRWRRGCMSSSAWIPQHAPMSNPACSVFSLPTSRPSRYPTCLG